MPTDDDTTPDRSDFVDWLHLWTSGVIVNEKIFLSPCSGRVDILDPILKLDGPAEDLVLDVHYSVSRPRVWEPEVLRDAAHVVLESLRGASVEFVVAQISDRGEMSRGVAEDVLARWQEDFERLIQFCSLFDEIIFTRVSGFDSKALERWTNSFNSRRTDSERGE